MKENTYKEIEIIDVLSPSILKENMTKYKMVEILKDGENIYAIENMGIKIKKEDKIFYDVTLAPDEFKSKYKNDIKELKVQEKQETKSFLKSIIDKFKTIKNEQDIITVIDSNSPVFNSLSPQDKKKIFNACQFIKCEEGLKKQEILIKNQINPEEPLYYDVSKLIMSDLDLWSKICNDIIEFKKQENGLYFEMNSLGNNINQKK